MQPRENAMRLFKSNQYIFKARYEFRPAIRLIIDNSYDHYELRHVMRLII